MKIQIDGLEFNSDYFYIQTPSIVERISFNNRTFYTKLKKYPIPITPTLLQQHHNHELSLSIPLIEDGHINYIVIEYQQKDWRTFYALLKNLLKSLNIDKCQLHNDSKTDRSQFFIPRDKLSLEESYEEVEKIKHLLELKSKRSYKIYPNRNLPIEFNIIHLPREKS